MSKPKQKPTGLSVDSGNRFLSILTTIAAEDAAGLRRAARSYGDSWKKRGGVGAFLMIARKWDRMENRLSSAKKKWDIFHGIATDDRGEGLIDDVRDLRRYLLLVEAEMRARGFSRGHRDNSQKGGRQMAKKPSKKTGKKMPKGC
mgnify:CR=1 FL=1